MDHAVRLPIRDQSCDLIVRSSEVRHGNRLSVNNVESVTLFIASWISLLSDSPISTSSKPLKLYKAFYKRLCKDFRGTVLSFDRLAHELASNCFLMGTASLSGDWIDDMKDTPVFFEYHHFYQSGDPQLFSFIYTFLTFGKKQDYIDEEFNDTAFRGWLSVEKRLNDLSLSGPDVVNIRTILSEVLPSLSSAELWPKHGPGSVAERGVGTDLNQKHNLIAFDRLLHRAFFDSHLRIGGLPIESGFHINKVLPDPSIWTKEKSKSLLPSRLHFVPKNLKVARSICMEPTTLMFFQQAVADMMQKAIEGSKLFRFIKLKDQRLNQNLSEFGSYTGSIDTLDLTSASDSLSFDLVKKVFPPTWKIFMIATRNPLVLTPDGIIPVKKFAPMGSAVCFPTQCIIFASVCIYAAHLASNQLPVAFRTDIMEKYHVHRAISSIREYTGRYTRSHTYQPFGVYGDDICVDSRLTPYVKSILSDLGFEVNESKSFVGSQAYRESCGKAYLGGVDVSPLYFRIHKVKRLITLEHIYSQVSLINEARSRGYKNLSSFLQHSLRLWHTPKRFGRFCVPFVLSTSTNFGIHVSNPVNNHLDRRWNSNLQREEFKTWTVLTKYGSHDSNHEKYALMRWWASHRDQEIDDNIIAGHKLTTDYRLGRRWTPLY